MLKLKEIATIIIVSLVLGVVISLLRTTELFLYATLSIFLIVVINLIGKKLTAHYFEAEVEIKLWEIRRFGFRPKEAFKKAFPIGVILPLLTAGLTYGYIVWLAPLVFDVKAKVYRAAKRHGLYSFSEMTEFHIGLIAAAGILANLILATIIYLLGSSIGIPPQMNFVKLSIWYTLYNMIPIGNLDGNKIFFGSTVLWTTLAAIVLAALGFTLLAV